MSTFFKDHKADFCLVAVLLLLAGGAYLLFSRGEAGAWVLVEVNGQQAARYPLDKAETYVLNGGTNILRVEDGQAWLTEADCPDKLCVHQGKIRYSGQCIVCLPNKLTVTIQGVDGDFDLIS